MAIQTSFTTNTTAADALDTLNAALTSISTINGQIAAIPPLASFGSATVAQNEGNSGTTAFIFPVTLDKVWQNDLTYEYVTVASATLPASATDFVGGVFPRGILTIPAGSVSASISIPVAGNTTAEPNKNFIVRLYRVAATSLGTILNDDNAGARMTQPWTSGEQLYAMDPDQISGADGSRVTTHTDPASSIVATAPGGTGPTLVKNVANGHAVLRFAGATAERLTIGKPASVVAATASGINWSYVLVIKSPNGNGSLNCPFGDDYSNDGTFSVAYASGAGAKYGGAIVPYGTFARDVRDDIKTLAFSGEPISGAGGRHFYNGVISNTSQTGKLGQNNDILLGAGANGAAAPGFAYQGDILGLYIINRALTAPEMLQAHLWACNKFGKASPLAGRTYFPVFDGDSITKGIGATNTTSYPSQIAIDRAWPLGAWANVGKPSAQMASSGTNANTLMDKAVRDVDGFADVTGLPVVLISGEWYNQGAAGGSSANGVPLANNNRTYATTRKATGKFAKQFHWTSTASNRNGGSRDSFNASLVSTPGDFDYIIPLHTNATIGVDGTETNTTYFGDQVHPTAAGYTVMKSVIAAAMAANGYST